MPPRRSRSPSSWPVARDRACGRSAATVDRSSSSRSSAGAAADRHHRAAQRDRRPGAHPRLDPRPVRRCGPRDARTGAPGEPDPRGGPGRTGDRVRAEHRDARPQVRQRSGADRAVRPPHHRGRGLQPGLARHAHPAGRQPRVDGGARREADGLRRQPRLHPHAGRGRSGRGDHELLREARPGDDRRARRPGLPLLEHRLLRRTRREGVRRLPGGDAARLRHHRAVRRRPSDVNGYRGAAIGGHELYPLLAAGMECLVVPRHLGWNDIGLEAAPARPRRAGPALHRSGGPARVRRHARRQHGRPADRHARHLRPGGRHPRRRRVRPRQAGAMGAGPLEHLRALLASEREDLL